MTSFFMRIDPTSLRADPRGWFRTTRDLREATDRNSCQIVHAHGVRAGAVAAIAWSKATRPKRLITVQGLHSLRRAGPLTATPAAWFNRAVLSRVDQVIAVSASDRDTIVNLRLARPARVVLVSPGISLAQLPPDTSQSKGNGDETRPPVLLWMGRFVEQKNPWMLLRLVERLRGIEATWLAAGSGPLLDAVRDRATRLDLPITFLGWREDALDVLASADLYVSTARWEGLPVALLEAAAAALPIVATDVPGNRDLLEEGVPIALAPADDDDAMAAMVRGLLTDRHGLASLGERTREAVERGFPVDVLSARMLEVYSGLTQ